MATNEKAAVASGGRNERVLEAPLYHTPLVDAREILATARVILAAGQVTEVRALDATGRGDNFPQTWSGYFNNPQAIAEAVTQLKSAKGVFIVPNPVHPGLLARAINRLRPVKKEPTTSDADVTRRRWLLVDADAVRPSGISATDDEHAAALERAQRISTGLTAEGWPAPIYADSGNGGHLMFRVDLPADDGGLVERCLAAVHERFSDAVVTIDRSVHNPARIWKLYGTKAGKGDDAGGTCGRPHRMARLIDVPQRLAPVPEELLRELAASAPGREPGVGARPASGSASGRAQDNPFDLQTWIRQQKLDVEGPKEWHPKSGGTGKRWTFPTCPWNPAHTNGSAYIVQFASGAIEAGCHHNGCAGRNWHALRTMIEPGWSPGFAAERHRSDEVNELNELTVDDHSFNSSNSYPIEPWPELSPEAFHGLAGELVRAVEPHTEADPVAVLMQLLVGFGSAIGRSAYFDAGGSKHYPNLFTVLVGPTSKGRKGTSWAAASHVLVAVDPEWAKRCVVSGLSSGEGLIWQVRDPIVKQVPVKQAGRYTGDYDEVTDDPGVADKRLLVLEEEFANVLKVMQREGNTLSPIIRRAWDNGDLRSMVKNQPACATGAHVSIVGHVTKDELRRHLDSTEAANGFGNRYLWPCVRRSKCLPEGGMLQAVDFSGPMERLSAALAGAKTAEVVTRDPAARELWHAVYPGLSEGKPGLAGSLTGRAEAQVMRLAMIYALMDGERVVRVPHLRAALALWAYCEASVRHVFGASLGDPVADQILMLLRAHPRGRTRTEISHHFGRNLSAERIGRALASLSEGGRARVCTENPERGRPIERWIAMAAAELPPAAFAVPAAPAAPAELTAPVPRATERISI